MSDPRSQGPMTSTTTVTPTLFFSEYIEGSSSNKAVEIYNPTGADVNLTGCSVRVYANGNSTTTNITNLTATVAN
ncbi:MAG: hypothetical protein CVU63_05755, partial [Deltaproteobacteria bacterium HGW-Deltaproteobacteria-20]